MPDPSEPTTKQLIERLNELSNSRITLQQRGRELEAENNDLREQLRVAQRLAATAQAQHPITQGDLDRVVSERKELKTRLDEVTTAHATELAERDREIRELKQVNEVLRNDLSSLQAAVQAAVSGLDDDSDNSNSDPNSDLLQRKTQEKEKKGPMQWLADKLAGEDSK